MYIIKKRSFSKKLRQGSKLFQSHEVLNICTLGRVPQDGEIISFSEGAEGNYKLLRTCVGKMEER